MICSAQFSPCRTWRYTLLRQWNAKPVLVWLLLNPSTADESRDDPTIRRCIGFSMNHGYGGLVILNLFAYRATNPKCLMDAADPVGPENDDWIIKCVLWRDVVCAWGNEPVRRGNEKLAPRIPAVRRLLLRASAIFCLRQTGAGQPEHPLYIPAKQSLTPYACQLT